MEGRRDDFERWRLCILALPTSQYLTPPLVAESILLRTLIGGDCGYHPLRARGNMHDSVWLGDLGLGTRVA